MCNYVGYNISVSCVLNVKPTFKLKFSKFNFTLHMKNIIVLVFVDYILLSFFLKTDRKSISVLIGPDLS